MLKRLAHLCLEVTDIHRTVAFYRDGIGLPMQFTYRQNGELRGVFFKIGPDSFIEAFQVEKPHGITHFCMESDDIDSFIVAMRAKGIECTDKRRGHDRTWNTWLRDPDGHAFEIHEYTSESMQRIGGEAVISWL